MTKAYPILKVDDVHAAAEKSALGLVTLSENKNHSTILNSLDAIADGSPPLVPEWNEQLAKDSFAVSYVHANPSQWYGRVSRGKFLSDTKQRFIQEILERRPQAIWLDQCLAQRKGDGDAGWAVAGLLPYGCMPVLVIGNRHKLHDVLQSYVELERFTQDILSVVTSELKSLLELTWAQHFTPTSDQNHFVVDFVEMCRFWPMMERALAHQAKGLFYETHTLKGLRIWIECLTIVKKKLESADESERSSSMNQTLRVILGDMTEMVEYILMQGKDEDHHNGLGYNVLTAFATVTGALGSGALMNAKLYQPEDRVALLLAGMCFNLFASAPLHRRLLAVEIIQIIDDPYRAFGRLSEKIPATYNSTAHALVGANALYNRCALGQISVPHSTVADEVAIFSHKTAQIPISRRWHGQWELIPHLSLAMRGNLIDIGERSMNSEPYDNFVMRQCFSTIDITGKSIQAVLCGSPLTEMNRSIPIIAISLFGATWTLRPVEKKIFAKYGLGGWSSRVVFLGICDTKSKIVFIEAMIVAHMTTIEEDNLIEGKIAKSSALNWIKNLLRRSSCPLDKAEWIQKWISTNIVNTSYTWYCDRQIINLHRFTWMKWVPRFPPSDKEEAASKNSNIKLKFVKLSCVAMKTFTTAPQIPLKDVIRFVQDAMLFTQQKIEKDHHTKQETNRVGSKFLEYTFRTWLGLISGIYRAYELQNGVKEASYLRLMLPGCSISSEGIELSSETIVEPDSAFVEGLVQTLPSLSVDKLVHDHERFYLLWDKRSSTTFWEAKEIILNSAHTEGMMLTMMLICLVKVGCDVPTGSLKSAKPNSTIHKALPMNISEHVLVYQIDHAIKNLCKELADSTVAHDIIYQLVERVVTNSRLSTQQCDWRIHPMLRRRLISICTSPGSSTATPMVLQMHRIFESLDGIHASICGVREAKIEVKPSQSFEEGTECSFQEMLRSYKLRKDFEDDNTNLSMDDELGHGDLKEVVHSRGGDADTDAEEEDTAESKQNQLAVTFEFLTRSESH